MPLLHPPRLPRLALRISSLPPQTRTSTLFLTPSRSLSSTPSLALSSTPSLTFQASPLRAFQASPLRAFQASSLRSFAASALRSSDDSHGSHYDPPGGWLFGVPPGEKYKKEGWEGVWVYGFFGSLGLAVVAYAYKPDSSIQTWALEEARRRLEAEGILPDPEVGQK